MKANASILLVNVNQRNLQLLSEFLRKEGYATSSASSLEEFDQILAGEHNVGLALVDITGFEQGIWQRCEQLRSKQRPFLVISPRQSVAIQQASLSHGARGVMIKPLVVKELIELVKSMLEERE
jgi:DNA-binding response OmpR family regulator